MKDVLIVATAGLKKDQLEDREHRLYPRVDYLELAKRVDASILNYSLYDRLPLGKGLCRVETFLRSDVSLALVGLLRSRQHRVVFTMSERAGIPLAALRKVIRLRRPFLYMLTFWSERQRRVIDGFNLFSEVDTLVTQNFAYAVMLRDELGVPPDKVKIARYSIDQRFFHPMHAEKTFDVLSVGEVRGRDYRTLIEALRPLDVSALVVASGHWYAREKRPTLDLETPTNVLVEGGYLPFQIREQYARARLVVVPTRRGLLGAGTTVVLEAMAMGLPVIANRGGVAGEFVLDGETGLLVEPEDPLALREAIAFLLGHPRRARQLGDRARQRIEEELTLEKYVDRLSEIIRGTAEQARAGHDGTGG